MRPISHEFFTDRSQAGVQLAQKLAAWRGGQVVVLAIPRGGVAVAAPVGQHLHVPLGIVVVRKIGAPHAPEFAIGAVTASGYHFFHAEAGRFGPADERAEALRRELQQARRRAQDLRRGLAPPVLRGRTVLLVDDGLATGATMRAAVHEVRAAQAARIIVAVPVGAAAACADLRQRADEVICLREVADLRSVGEHYADFPQISDDQVHALLAATAVSGG